MWHAVRTAGLALRRGARRGWTAIRASTWTGLFAALTAVGQWGLLAGLIGAAGVAAAGLAGALPAGAVRAIMGRALPGTRVDEAVLTLAMLAAGLVLVLLGPATVWVARRLLRRAGATPAAFLARRRAVRRRAWALALLALAASALLAEVGGPTARASLVGWLGLAVMALAPLCLATGWMGWRVGLSWRARRRLLAVGLALTLLVLWASAHRVAPPVPRPHDAFALLGPFIFVLLGYLACAAWTLRVARRIQAAPVTPGLTLPGLFLPSAAAPPPPPLDLPRSPVTGMVRRRLEL